MVTFAGDAGGVKVMALGNPQAVQAEAVEAVRVQVGAAEAVRVQAGVVEARSSRLEVPVEAAEEGSSHLVVLEVTVGALGGLATGPSTEARAFEPYQGLVRARALGPGPSVLLLLCG